MSYESRIEIYSKIEYIRKRPLISFITSMRQNASGGIASDAIPEFIKQLQLIKNDEKSVDVLIVSNGGDPIVPWRIINMLRERFEHVGVLVPYVAYSAATLLALGADEIVMHPFANLGPVDPQLSTPKRQGDTGEAMQFGAEDVRYFLEFVRQEVGITDQEQLEKAFELLCKDVGAIPLGVAKRSSELTLSLGEQLLKLHMTDNNKVKAISEALSRSYYSHSFTLGRKQAKEIGLPVATPQAELEDVMWNIWKDIEAEWECNIPYSPISFLFSNPKAAALFGPVQQVEIPANLPPNVMQQAYNNILQQIQVISIEPIEFNLTYAAIESMRARSVFISKGILNAIRRPDMNIAVNSVQISQNYEYSDNIEVKS